MLTETHQERALRVADPNPLIAGFSIGLFYLPIAVLLVWPERR